MRHENKTNHRLRNPNVILSRASHLNGIYNRMVGSFGLSDFCNRSNWNDLICTPLNRFQMKAINPTIRHELRCMECNRVVDIYSLKAKDMAHPKLPNSKLPDHSQVVWKCPRCGCWEESE